MIDKATSELLGLNFIYGVKTSIVIDAARMCMREYGFHIQDDISILDPLPMNSKVDCYGLSAQARFGDNNTPKPDPLDLIENIKWANWNDKKGMDPQVAKITWLKLVEPLILKRGFPKCNW